MDEINLKDSQYRRVSACPLHFIWDGRGEARKLVRFGFIAVVLALGLKMGNRLLPAYGLNTAGAPLLMFGGLLWGYGQVKSVWLVFCQKRDQNK